VLAPAADIGGGTPKEWLPLVTLETERLVLLLDQVALGVSPDVAVGFIWLIDQMTLGNPSCGVEAADES
jgi:hypothetical protein